MDHRTGEVQRDEPFSGECQAGHRRCNRADGAEHGADRGTDRGDQECQRQVCGCAERSCLYGGKQYLCQGCGGPDTGVSCVCGGYFIRSGLCGNE